MGPNAVTVAAGVALLFAACVGGGCAQSAAPLPEQFLEWFKGQGGHHPGLTITPAPPGDFRRFQVVTSTEVHHRDTLVHVPMHLVLYVHDAIDGRLQ